ncbi:MAG: sigma-70 family RNA polymerase sigma factor [Bacteroidota bacterium]
MEEELIHKCLKHDRNAQRVLYEQYFGKMMGVCIRYSKNQQDAKEIFFSGFINIFTNIKEFVNENSKRKKSSPLVSLEEWIKKMIIKSAIKLLHQNKKEYFVSSTVNVRDAESLSPGISENILDEQLMSKINLHLILKAIHQLSPSYRTVYNMHEVDNYSHKEISVLLDISEPTSKDNLLKAKYNIHKNLVRMVR